MAFCNIILIKLYFIQWNVVFDELKELFVSYKLVSVDNRLNDIMIDWKIKELMSDFGAEETGKIYQFIKPGTRLGV